MESDRGLGTKLTEAVARNHKLMAYKDEYEVARLYRRPEFMQRLQGRSRAATRSRFHLAPPIFANPIRSQAFRASARSVHG